MKLNHHHAPFLTALFCACMLLPAVSPVLAHAQTIPNSADVSRVKPEDNKPLPLREPDAKIDLPIEKSQTAIPEASQSITFVLRSVKITGATAFPHDELCDIYLDSIGKEITLAEVYKMTGAITERYRNAGYFLSRAFVPAQEIDGGDVTIRVVEGYVGAVDGLNDNNSSIVQAAADDLTKQRPLSSLQMERFLLLLNDIPGNSYGGTLSPLDGSSEGAVKLTLTVKKEAGRGTITFDNYSSRFLGPNELSASYTTSLLENQQTTISALSDVGRTKLRYGTLEQSIAIASDLKINVSGGVTQALPGYSLEASEIESSSVFASVDVVYQWMRQRQQNLALKATLDGRNVTSDILKTPLTRDYIRAFRANVNYDVQDAWKGSNTVDVTVSRGLDWLSASQKNDLNLSRIGATPDFTKAEATVSRLQGISQDWSFYTAASGQWASGVLYSSEQFGYGGQNFGRAFDASDITGDHGVKGLVELRYGGFVGDNLVNVQPYGFYDIGKVWNEAAGQPSNQTASSAGLGIRFNTVWKQSGNFGLAWPLERDITTPIYGVGQQGPRIILQISQQF